MTRPAASVPRVLADLQTAFRSVKARWYVFGAQAVAAAGVPRFTADVDVTVEVPPRGIRAVLDALERHHLTARDVGDLESFIAQARIIPMVHENGIPVDVVLAGPGLEEDMLDRVTLRTIGRRKVPFVSTSDLVSLKVLAGRDKDLGDVRALLRASPKDLSIPKVRAVLHQLGVALGDSELEQTFAALVAAAKKR